MKQTRRLIRVFSLVLCVLALFTVITYITMVRNNAARWLNSAQNTRLQEARKTTRQGTIYDSSELPLAWSDGVGDRRYISNELIRRAVSHTVGDQLGMSETGVENRHATTLLGLSDVTGADKTIQKLMGGEPVGYDLVLTLNAEASAYIAGLFPKGSRGACVIINYKTGAILAKVSLPGYDPANIYANVEDTSYYDRATQYRYAPGSTFKIVTLASALENLPDVKNESFECSGEWSFARSTIRCANAQAHGRLSLKDAFSKSCNITFSKLAYRIGADKLKATAEKFAFNDNFIFGDTVLYPSSCLEKSGSDGEVIQAGFGQGTTEATPLHMAMIAGAIANEGVMMEPKLIKEVRRPKGGEVSSLSPKAYKRVCSAEDAGTIAQYMYEVVKSGTGTQAAIPGYNAGKVCGKTGSAEFSNDKSLTHAWYVGFLYGDGQHPYAIAVVVEQGGSGGSVAAPIAAKALKKAMDLKLY